MEILEQYKKEHPEAFRKAPAWQPPQEYGFWIRLVMRLSGGRITDLRKASIILFGFAALLLVIAVYFFFFIGRGPRLPPEREILRDTPQQGLRPGAE